MLQLEWRKIYKVKHGQTLCQIAETFCVSQRLLAQENGLTQEVFEGQILTIPKERGNAYTAKPDDTKELLCGSEEGFVRKNGGSILYPAMRVIL